MHRSLSAAIPARSMVITHLPHELQRRSCRALLRWNLVVAWLRAAMHWPAAHAGAHGLHVAKRARQMCVRARTRKHALQDAHTLCLRKASCARDVPLSTALHVQCTRTSRACYVHLRHTAQCCTRLVPSCHMRQGAANTLARSGGLNDCKDAMLRMSTRTLVYASTALLRTTSHGCGAHAAAP
jgi:hypothetical protein